MTIFIKFSSILFVTSFFIVVRIVSTSFIVARIARDIREEIYNKVINLREYANLKKNIGDIIATLNSDVVVLETCLTTQYPIFLRSIFASIASIIMIFITNIKLTIYIALIIPIVAACVALLSKNVKLSSDMLRNSVGEFSSRIEEFLNRIKLIQSLNYEKISIEKVNALIHNTYKYFIRYSVFRSTLIVTVIIIIFSAISFIISAGVYDVVNNKIALGDFAASIMYIIIAANSLSTATESFSELTQLKSVTLRINNLLELECSNTKLDYTSTHFEKIVFENVSFCYPHSKTPSLKNFSLCITKNSKIAIIGSSGAGKSTVIQLLLGFYQQYEGFIKIDGIDIRCIERSALHSIFAWVPQENSLFSGTIKENIKIGNQYASEDKIILAAKNAKVLEFSENLEYGLDTVIGENNTNISYGQKQRVSIARAFIKDSQVLLLDEPTSSLDNINEKYITESINKIGANKTIILVTHKLDQIKEFETIIVMKEGNIIELGSHNHLIKIKGEYYKMCAL